MRRGKVGLQLGANQKYYISLCEEKQSIQLTITIKGNDKKHVQERRDLINDVTKSLENIMKMFMPGTKRPSLLIPCALCPILHIPFDDICSGKTIFCPFAGDESLSHDYYSDLLPVGLADATTTSGKMMVVTNNNH